jgi:c-di-GMP-binding flagellar brake protein YcgR
MISLPAGEEIEAQALDLSQEGISIVTKHNIPIYAELIVMFILFRMDRNGVIIFNEPLELTGEIRSNILFNNSERRLGIWFKNIDPEKRCSISQYIASIEHNN